MIIIEFTLVLLRLCINRTMIELFKVTLLRRHVKQDNNSDVHDGFTKVAFNRAIIGLSTLVFLRLYLTEKYLIHSK